MNLLCEEAEDLYQQAVSAERAGRIEEAAQLVARAGQVEWQQRDWSAPRPNKRTFDYGEACQLRAAGLSYPKIGARLGVAHHAVSDALRRMAKKPEALATGAP